MTISGGSRIFLGAPNPKVGVLTYFFLAENCMKMKEFGALHSDPPLTILTLLYWKEIILCD